ncbi:MAG: hypothetical protein NC826_03090 [Candidatus Omnitrophica bacterium]|nr:hypothetical protein [Candidatus Omnitrophota bacterium]
MKLDNCLLTVETEDEFRDKKTINLNPRERQKQTFRWVPRREGIIRLKTVIKVSSGIEEKNTRNNEKIMQVLVKPKRESHFSRREVSSEREGSPLPKDSGEPVRYPQEKRERKRR